MKKGNLAALLPIGVFFVLYLGLGIIFEYVMKIPMGFYNIPIVVAFMVAILTACLQNHKISFEEKLEIMAKGIADKNIITMLLIFLTAGVFVGVVGRGSAESVAYFLLSVIPAQFSVMVLFIAACFVSLAMGTSVGTITLITPIAVSLAAASGSSLPLCVGAVVSGAMFGDNLSFISDTTIAACNGQGCAMQDKFKENFHIAVPAALGTLAVLFAISINAEIKGTINHAYSLLQILPYLVVLGGGIVGINVFVVLIMGIAVGIPITLLAGNTAVFKMITNIGAGANGMFETSMVAILVGALSSLINSYGGFEALLYWIQKVFVGKKNGQLGVGVLVMLMDIATANNTVAIVISNPIAKEMSKNYGINNKKTASILDTFSCIAQGVIPYGAQILVAISAVSAMGAEISAFQILPNLYYPMLLAISSLIFIYLIDDKQ